MALELIPFMIIDCAAATAFGVACLLLYHKIGHTTAFAFGMLLLGLAGLSLFYCCLSFSQLAGVDSATGMRLKAYATFTLMVTMFILCFFNVRVAYNLCALAWKGRQRWFWLTIAATSAAAMLAFQVFPIPLFLATGLLPLGSSLLTSVVLIVHKKAPLLAQIPKSLKRASLISALVLVPLIVLDSFKMNILGIGTGFALPLYLTITIILFGVAGFRLFEQPMYSEGGRLSNYFIGRFSLSKREVEVAELAFLGKNSSDIADALSISPKTVENHFYHIYQKTKVKSRVELYQLIKSMSEDLWSGRQSAD